MAIWLIYRCAIRAYRRQEVHVKLPDPIRHGQYATRVRIEVHVVLHSVFTKRPLRSFGHAQTARAHRLGQRQEDTNVGAFEIDLRFIASVLVNVLDERCRQVRSGRQLGERDFTNSGRMKMLLNGSSALKFLTGSSVCTSTRFDTSRCRMTAISAGAAVLVWLRCATTSLPRSHDSRPVACAHVAAEGSRQAAG